MQIEKLEDNKVRVHITAADLISMDIDINTLDTESVELNRFLFNIMERIREETGFNPYGGQVVMEAMRDNEGNISIVVSKAAHKTHKITREQFETVRGVRTKNKQIKEPVTEHTHTETFYIETFDDVCAVLCELKYNTLLKCALYKIGDVYSILMEYNLKTAKSMAVLTEFAVRKSYYPMQEAYVREHGELIARGRRLAQMGKGIKELNIKRST